MGGLSGVKQRLLKEPRDTALAKVGAGVRGRESVCVYLQKHSTYLKHQLPKHWIHVKLISALSFTFEIILLVQNQLWFH